MVRVTCRNVRPQAPQRSLARIVLDLRDGTRDRFMPKAEAHQLYMAGKLHLMDMGPAYPDTYRSADPNIIYGEQP